MKMKNKKKKKREEKNLMRNEIHLYSDGLWMDGVFVSPPFEYTYI